MSYVYAMHMYCAYVIYALYMECSYQCRPGTVQNILCHTVQNVVVTVAKMGCLILSGDIFLYLFKT